MSKKVQKKEGQGGRTALIRAESVFFLISFSGNERVSTKNIK
jgi:hypothetical protein